MKKSLEQQVIEAKEAYDNSGCNIKAASARIGVSHSKLRKLLITGGVQIMPRDKDLAMALYHIRGGVAIEDAARMCGVSIKRINNYLPYTRGPLKQWGDEEIEALRTGKNMQRSITAQRVMRSRLISDNEG